ncbi:fumarate hydratase [Ignatzschineria rhizosphaerae]|uniref:Fumarate hydratase n=1 Tax=Ignatzschineria rhizosphaerae TaxID=2923279 RepID=A0ABY3X224_9GAMM|nr:fumarate hydratase [Ignatzschineria rhizosphaerae]UNM96927.1 fumarate hydratase [Ignatzschineria rhizosphaerae]
MRQIHIDSIRQLVADLCIEANTSLSQDVYQCLGSCMQSETSSLGKNILQTIIANADLAKKELRPMCQDTGQTVIFVQIGQDVQVVGGLLEDAINAGIREGYQRGYLRNSVVKSPFERVNTNDNTPGVIHYDIIAGDRLLITVSPKGFGSENMSQLKMLKPSDGLEGVKQFILQVVKDAGSNPCPPIIVGVGIGGTMEKAAILSKQALLKPLDKINEDPFLASLEAELLEKVNALEIGPAGFGGRTTALGVNINTYPTHIAGLPVAVNIGCHANRHVDGQL